MENLSINASLQNKQIPQIFLNADNGKGEITGASFHENAFYLYKEVTNWINEYLEENKTLALTFGVNYFNTPSAKGIYNILATLKEWTHENKEISLKWYVFENDDDLYEDIETLAEDVELNISIIMSDKKHQIAS
ncbi:DUF1987 domain-containing protein [Flammeovirga sp. EKP202]|uniref:DUF1987 domain-containing protein n=1 Tax=Flammeovirga sp. EKP202 TaxID=2770592 RepID=UPI00165ED7D9|nr:DUF1987 domain-containing protein [Flammeovirga sp. EKP202]MBD0402152.1 DUF1987 domain-containing protein [Flammeovirga sp. EKP202]